MGNKQPKLPSQQQTLHLYRGLLRECGKYQSSNRASIFQEIQSSFRAHRFIKDKKVLKEKFEGANEAFTMLKRYNSMYQVESDSPISVVNVGSKEHLQGQKSLNSKISSLDD